MTFAETFFRYISSDIACNIIIYIVYICVHTISANIYVYYCSPFTLYGLLFSPIIIISPHCKTMLWIMNHTSYNIQLMWVLIGTWILKNIISKFSVIKTHTDIDNNTDIRNVKII
jgi:hypothetical protein